MITFSNPFCHKSDRTDPRKPAYYAAQSNAVYVRNQERKKREGRK